MTQRQKVKETAVGGAVGGGAVAAAPSPLFRGPKSLQRRSKVGGIPVVKFKNEAKDFIHKLSLRQSLLTALLTEFAQNEFSPADIETKMRSAERRMDFQHNTVAFGLQDADGNVVKVYVRPDQAQDFEKAVSSQLDDSISTSQEIAELLFNLRNRYDIVHTEWPTVPEDAEEEVPGGDELPNLDAEGGGEEGDLPDIEGGDELPVGDEGSMVPGADEGVKSALDKVIDMLKADAEARKAEADAKTAEARAKEAEYTAQIATQKVRSEQEVLDAEAYYRQKKEDQKEARKLSMLAKYRHDQARETEDGMVQGMFGESHQEWDEDSGPRRYTGIDDQLYRNGWEEDGGIGLWTNRKYSVWVDTNADMIMVYPIRGKGPFNNSDDDFLNIFHDFDEFRAWLMEPKEDESGRKVPKTHPLIAGETNGTYDYDAQEQRWRESDIAHKKQMGWK